MSTLEEEFVLAEQSLLEDLERYRELCERMGFNFIEHVDDVINQAEGRY